jgi:hypothetical protein
MRAQRSLVLGALVAGSRMAEEWLTEEPGNPDAALLYARATAARALRADENGDPLALEFAVTAWDAAFDAIKTENDDPTPWVCLLALARFRKERVPGPQGVDAPGPWDLLAEVQQRSPWHREAFHRLLAAFFARHGGSHAAMWEVADWAFRHAPPYADARLLPLIAYAEHYRARVGSASGVTIAERQWSANVARDTALDIYANWFPHTARLPAVPVADLSLLAHALIMAGYEAECGQVLRQMRPYATTFPWSLHGEPEPQLLAAYKRCGVKPP